MKTFGLIGYPLSHSFSKKFFGEKFEQWKRSDCQYELFPLTTISELGDLLKNEPSLNGLNVTIPYKIEVIPLLSKLDKAAEAIGAVNCIKFCRNSEKLELIGYNTDAYGFEASLLPLLSNFNMKALVLGNGGAAQAVKYVLRALGIDYLTVSRDPLGGDLTYAEITPDLIKTHLLLINTTPLGMSPHVDNAPEIPYEFVGDAHIAYDLVYNPALTKFLELCSAQGAKIKNGSEMLILQAEKSWEIWNS